MPESSEAAEQAGSVAKGGDTVGVGLGVAGARSMAGAVATGPGVEIGEAVGPAEVHANSKRHKKLTK